VSPATTAVTLASEHGYIAVLPSDAAGSSVRASALTRLRLTGLPRWRVSVSVAYRERDAGQQPVAATLRALHAMPLAGPLASSPEP
jgi:hypothetical protein